MHGPTRFGPKGPGYNPQKNSRSADIKEYLSGSYSKRVQEHLMYTCKHEVKKFLIQASNNAPNKGYCLKKAGELIFLKNLMEKMGDNFTIESINYETSVDLTKNDRFFHINSIEFVGKGSQKFTLSKEIIEGYVENFQDTLESYLDKHKNSGRERFYDYKLSFPESISFSEFSNIVSGACKKDYLFLNLKRSRILFNFGKEVGFSYTGHGVPGSPQFTKKTTLGNSQKSLRNKVVVFKEDATKREKEISTQLNNLIQQKYELSKTLSELPLEVLDGSDKELNQMLKLLILENYLKQAKDKKLDLRELRFSWDSNDDLSNINSLFIKTKKGIEEHKIKFDQGMLDTFKNNLKTVKVRKHGSSKEKLLDFKIKTETKRGFSLEEITDLSRSLEIKSLDTKSFKNVKRIIMSTMRIAKKKANEAIFG